MTKKPIAAIERLITIGLITSKEYIITIQSILDLNLLQSKFTKMVCYWCIDYFQQYEEAPNHLIENIFEVKKSNLDESLSKAIRIFLESIADEYEREKFNLKYYVDETIKYIKFRKCQQLSDEITGHLLSNDILSAEAAIFNFNKTQLPESDSINIFKDIEKVKIILSKRDDEVILQFPGKLGEIINDSYRGELFSFSGFEKAGKSFWLQWSAFLSLFSGYNVAYFSFELNQTQMLTRFASYLTGRPTAKKYLECKIPYLTSNNRVRYDICRKELLSPVNTAKELISLVPILRGRQIYLQCWPPRTHSLSDVKSKLDIWEHEYHFIPDFIVLDLADRIEPEKYANDFQHGIDSIWEGAKQLALERNVLVATATHTTWAAAKKRIDKTSATSWDKRKAGHVDRLVAINQSEKDEKEMVSRINCIYDRSGATSSHIDVVVLQQFAIAAPCLGSFIEEREGIKK